MSSGYIFLSHGIVGSIKGRGVCKSKKIGRLMATLDPLRERIFAVKVLDVFQLKRIISIQLCEHTGIVHVGW